MNKEKTRIDSLLISLSKKAKEVSPRVAASNSGERKENTFLKKTEPPKWEGDPVYFADFMRKWKAQVSTSNLPEESELDRLRDSIPDQAAKALYGEKEMKGAWATLQKLYGDKKLIVNKLKSQLKNITVKAKKEYDIVY